MQRRERFDESGNLAKKSPDRPPVKVIKIVGGFEVDRADRIPLSFKAPLTEPRVVRGKTIGGGMSAEAIRRARRNAAKSH